MVDYGKVRSTIKPESVVIDDYSVWENTNIEAVSENVGTEAEFNGFEYNMVQYDKNEYILKQAQANAELSDQLTETQLALCDVYEMIQ
jgi:hypothetical protein